MVIFTEIIEMYQCCRSNYFCRESCWNYCYLIATKRHL